MKWVILKVQRVRFIGEHFFRLGVQRLQRAVIRHRRKKMDMQAVNVGLAGNEISKRISGTHEVSAGRTAVAVGSGAALGAVTAGTLSVGAVALGVASAPIAVPLAIAGGVISGLASLFD